MLRAANALRYRDYLTVVLIVNREQVFPDNWIYINSHDVKLGRIQNYKNWSPHMVPDPSRTSLGLEYFLWDRDEEWSWTHERLIEQGINDCTTLGLIDRREVEDGTVVRMRQAYPVYDQSYQEHLTTIRRYVAGLTNLQLIGRNGQHRYNNQDHLSTRHPPSRRSLSKGDCVGMTMEKNAEATERMTPPVTPLMTRIVAAKLPIPTPLPHRRTTNGTRIATSAPRIMPSTPIHLTEPHLP